MVNKYEDRSDEELIVALYDELITEDEKKTITDYLLNKYKNLVKTLAKSMFIIGGDSDDLMQEGMIGLFKAAQTYDESKGASFKTYADMYLYGELTLDEAASMLQEAVSIGIILFWSMATNSSPPILNTGLNINIWQIWRAAVTISLLPASCPYLSLVVLRLFFCDPSLTPNRILLNQIQIFHLQQSLLHTQIHSFYMQKHF